MKIHHLNCGTMCPYGGRLISGEGGLTGARIVCHCLLIEAGDSLVLIDTGLGTGDVAHPYRTLGIPFTAGFGVQADPRETAVAQIRELGLDPADVRQIACTHLDLDHAGGLPDFPDAEVHVFAPERDAAVRPSLRERLRYPTRTSRMARSGSPTRSTATGGWDSRASGCSKVSGPRSP